MTKHTRTYSRHNANWNEVYEAESFRGSIYDLERLIYELEAGFYHPPRFRNLPYSVFKEVELPEYVRYLKRELDRAKKLGMSREPINKKPA